MNATPKLWRLALVFCLMVGCQQSPQASIRRVLKQDDILSQRMKTEVPGKGNEALDALAERISAVALEMRQMDLRGCPDDFARAYAAHAKAWQDLGLVVQLHPDIPTPLEGFISGFVQGLQGDFSGGVFRQQAKVQEWQEEAEAARKQIIVTWRGVEDSAIRHGAKIP